VLKADEGNDLSATVTMSSQIVRPVVQLLGFFAVRCGRLGFLDLAANS
jgi:hypothetical protein